MAVTGARVGELFEAARSGDRACLDTMVRELSPMLWHVARAQGLDRMSCADIVQNTWLRLITSWEDVRTPSALIGWLVTVTKREAWRYRRSHSAEDVVDSFDDMVDHSPSPEERVVTAADNEDLWATLKRLPQKCRRLLRVLAFTHRPDYTALSAELSMPRGTIGPTRGRCLAKLRTLLTENARGT